MNLRESPHMKLLDQIVVDPKFQDLQLESLYNSIHGLVFNQLIYKVREIVLISVRDSSWGSVRNPIWGSIQKKINKESMYEDA